MPYFLSTKEYAAANGLSVTTVRAYCASGRLPGARLVGGAWRIPQDVKPLACGTRHASELLSTLAEQMASRMKGGIYHRTQVDFAYNSNHIEGGSLTHDETRYIFETNTIGLTNRAVKVDDIIETVNHFRCVDYVIANASAPLTDRLIKHLHAMLKTGTSDAAKPWFAVGGYKRLPNEVGGEETVAPRKVGTAMRSLLSDYAAKTRVSIDDIIDFHHQFESIHPFQDGNGRIGRLIMFKECLRHGIVPFIITDSLRFFYYRGLREWPAVKGFLRDTCLSAQDDYKEMMRYFHVKY